MTKFEEEGLTSKSSGNDSAPLGDQVIAWARRRFGTDFDRSESVRDLQVRLRDLGYEVFADGIFGASTLEALGAHRKLEERRAPRSESPSQKVATEAASVAGDPAAAEPGDDITNDRGEAEATGETLKTDTESLTAQPVALSDSALESVADDRLGFAPYVVAVVRFLLAEQTRAPLALAINAPWGRGKTSFMNMIDSELHAAAQGAGVRVATTRFNPWKYSEAEQVWAAFVGNVARCIRDNLTPVQRFRFWLSRLWAKIRRNADLGLVIRIVVAVVFLSLLTLMFALEWSSILEALKNQNEVLEIFLTALVSSGSSGVAGWLGYLALVLAVLLAVAALYVGFANKLGLNLLDYLEKTDFKDKIGTLSQFEDEMRRLSAAVPANMKVVVFVDDLDRCKGPVLGEIVEALQLADVSRSCIFVLGMDLNIVANVIEKERQELAQSVDSGNGKLEHGSGYKFLEKIIQARLSLPDYGPAEMRRLIAQAMAPDRPDSVQPDSAQPEQRKDGVTGLVGEKDPGLVETVMEKVETLNPFHTEEHIRDSSLVVQTATYYGGGHFQNPRRLKRFINGFRLQTYLAASKDPQIEGVDRLARLLVLAEKWPALLERIVESKTALEECKAFLLDAMPDPKTRQGTSETHLEALGLYGLSDVEKARLQELLLGLDSYDPFEFDDLKELAEWYGFCYYPGLAKED